MFVEDILYHIRQHLPFVDRRELSLVCKAFREPLQEVFMEYMRMAVSRSIYLLYDAETWLTGDLMSWVLIEAILADGLVCNGMLDFTESPELYILPRRIPGGSLRHINRMTNTNLHKIAYNNGKLYVKNWEVLLRRRAIIVPNTYFKSGETIERYYLNMKSLSEDYRKARGITLVVEVLEWFQYHSKLMKCATYLKAVTSPEKYIDCLGVFMEGLVWRDEYSSERFLEPDTNRV